MRRLDGKVALISGTAGGQGRAVARRFAAEGALVVGGDLLHEQALDTQRLIAREGGTALTPGPLDVTDEQSVSSWVHEAVDAFGGIDIVYANAGAVRFGPVDSRPYRDFAFTMRAELDSVRLTVRSAWPHLRRSRGCILTLGSTAGLTGSLTNRTTAHSASRGAVIALTRQLAAEGAPYGIRANCVSPGAVGTAGSRATLLCEDHPVRAVARPIPLGRAGGPDDVVDAAVLLASDEAAHITGADLVVDGDWSAVVPGTSP
ncbi:MULTISPECIES: SDR family NAD(P)-dependent oxidoreductase [unclassified Streptomyces]|uniref:SDR family NAD(P)-dependent oxidoreductase n=1 Tax=unclassified Streptomyces TaxID=2593676 RepID=UPI00224FDA89|nr:MULTISPECIES: SDR family NAD(P)-dependent oxidoreductase [unclassified Streptomyces]MCX4992928.1 SDR family oxidoreductase [Streptomyces sp. NBC_00568]MCX5001836.1 SDR family oxidoreductase [Streptomyces sp. NBC_00638]